MLADAAKRKRSRSTEFSPVFTLAYVNSLRSKSEDFLQTNPHRSWKNPAKIGRHTKLDNFRKQWPAGARVGIMEIRFIIKGEGWQI